MHSIILLPNAESDVDGILTYLAARSRQGADAWCKAWENVLRELRVRPQSFGLAPESDLYDEEIRHAHFKTRCGRMFRALFAIVDDTVHVLHVRGPGQDVVRPDEIRLPKYELHNRTEDITPCPSSSTAGGSLAMTFTILATWLE